MTFRVAKSSWKMSNCENQDGMEHKIDWSSILTGQEFPHVTLNILKKLDYQSANTVKKLVDCNIENSYKEAKKCWLKLR